jgi:hypothetical protein
MKIRWVVLLGFIGLCLVLGLAISTVGNHAVDVWAEQDAQPVSASELILQSRQTAPVSQTNNKNDIWFGVGLLAFVVVVFGGVIFLMQGGSQLLRQWRLAKKRPSRRQNRPHVPNYIPYNNDWPEIRNAPTVRYLPEVDDEQVVDSFD